MEALDYVANSCGWIIAINAIVWVFFIFFAVKEIKGRRKHGKWVLKTFDDGYGEYQLYECNQCGAVTAQRKSKNYCHNCGAKMESIEAEGEDNASM